MVNFYNVDCMEHMANTPNKYYDLAIVDPPYGIHDKLTRVGKLSKGSKFSKMYSLKNWDKERPQAIYFNEVLRVSKNALICGGNYFADLLPPSSGWIVWDKLCDGMSSVNPELIYSTFNKSVKIFKRGHWLDKGFMNKEPRIHPTQKPAALYKWLLTHYAKEGDKIFDSHGGSMSSAIACNDLHFDLDICELDKDYFDAGVKRFNNHILQTTLF